MNILNMLHNLLFFTSKCRLFHNATFFGSCIIHILNTGCAKIKKKNFGTKGLIKLKLFQLFFGKTPQIRNLIKIIPVGAAQLLYVDRRTEVWKDMTTIIMTSRSFVNSPNYTTHAKEN